VGNVHDHTDRPISVTENPPKWRVRKNGVDLCGVVRHSTAIPASETARITPD